jgi:hypothetical protein
MSEDGWCVCVCVCVCVGGRGYHRNLLPLCEADNIALHRETAKDPGREQPIPIISERSEVSVQVCVEGIVWKGFMNLSLCTQTATTD